MVVLGIVAICYTAVVEDIDINQCIMTYMYPNYIKLHDDKFSRLAHKYDLYLYKEGPHARKEV